MNNYLDKKYTFKKLFMESDSSTDRTITTISIPIIQRDYAQGRTSPEVNRVRNRFLQTLYTALHNQSPITLDFIYGGVSEDGIFTPLDGQQRLTTLYLLHWYAAKHENVPYDQYSFLCNFTYETRFSSRNFCEKLVLFTPDFSKEKLSDEIKDQNWYQFSWLYDPTIQSMLVMIDAIHDKFKNTENIWVQLTQHETISFLFLQLREMGLTDDLYIKMNSRGKPLTIFEHFKAEFEDVLKKHSSDLADSVKCKFDLDWTDMLFAYRGSNQIIDDEFIRYFHYISYLLCFKRGIPYIQDEFQLIDLLYAPNANNALNNIYYLINSLDCWYEIYKNSKNKSGIDSFFEETFTTTQYETGKILLDQNSTNLFKKCCDLFSAGGRSFPLSDIIMLYSIIEYLMNRETISYESFIKRFRVIRNLVWNSSDELRLDRMPDLLKETQTIINTGEILLDNQGFNQLQKNEEIDKSLWLKDNYEFSEQLYQLESHYLLKGSVRIIGLENFSNSNNFEKLFMTLEQNKFIPNGITIHKALLTFGDYTQRNSFRLYSGTKKTSTWFDLFHQTRKRGRFDHTSKILNNLLTYFETIGFTQESLQNHIKSYLNDDKTVKDLRYYLIKYPSSMLPNSDGYYYFLTDIRDLEKTYDIVLMNSISRGGKTWNIYLKILHDILNDTTSLGESYFSLGDRLNINGLGYSIDCINNKWIVYQNEEEIISCPILQENNYDLEDRIEIGKKIVKELITH